MRNRAVSFGELISFLSIIQEYARLEIHLCWSWCALSLSILFHIAS